MVPSGPRTVLLATLLVLVGGSLARAAEKDPAEDPDPKPYRALASRASPGTPEIDGRLDDAAWAMAVIPCLERFPELVHTEAPNGTIARLFSAEFVGVLIAETVFVDR